MDCVKSYDLPDETKTRQGRVWVEVQLAENRGEDMGYEYYKQKVNEYWLVLALVPPHHHTEEICTLAYEQNRMAKSFIPEALRLKFTMQEYLERQAIYERARLEAYAERARQKV